MYDVGLIGCSGFLAEHLLKNLKNNNLSVVGFGRTNPGVEFLDNFLKFDLTSDDKIPGGPFKIDLLIFNSVKKGRFEQYSNDWSRQGQISAPNFDQMLSKLNIQCERLLTIGSSEEYGPRETDREILESDDLLPISSYGHWKKELYKNSQLWARTNKKNTIHLRPFNIFGAGQDSNMFLGSLFQALIKDEAYPMTKGEQWRSFVSVNTVCSVVAKLFFTSDWVPVSTSSCLNVSEPHYYQIRHVAEIVREIVGMGSLKIGEIPYRDFEVWHQKPSLQKITTLMGENYASNFKNEIVNLYKYYQGKKIWKM